MWPWVLTKLALTEMGWQAHSWTYSNGLSTVWCGTLDGISRQVIECCDSPWTGLLTSGDGGCHQWMAVGVRVTPLGRCNINRTTWEQSCQVHDMDIRQMDAQHMLADRHGKYCITNGYLLGLWLTWREFQQSRAYKAELRRVTKDVVKSEV